MVSRSRSFRFREPRWVVGERALDSALGSLAHTLMVFGASFTATSSTAWSVGGVARKGWSSGMDVVVEVGKEGRCEGI